MCGIWAQVGSSASATVSPAAREQFMKIVGRGPDLSVIEQVAPGVSLGFHRLAIVIPGDTPSAQPIVGDGLSVVCNGEIYNHKQIKETYPLLGVTNGGSDCASIVHAFLGTNGDLSATCASLDGVFAFVMADAERVYIGRDPIGVRPLFYGHSADGSLIIGSEIKCIEDLCERVEYFPPGCCATVSLLNRARTLQVQPRRYFTIPSIADRFHSIENAQLLIRETLLKAVEKRLMGNRHFGFMLSGGLDSSLIAAIATKYLPVKPIAFSVGFEDSPDLENARRVAEFLNIPLRVLVITAQDCIDIIPEVVYALETFDPLILRCGIAHYLLCKHISATSDVKVLLSGEGADELFGSYAYMQRAPNQFHLHKEILRRLHHLHQYDVLRCDRSTSCHGLEIRVPFLDKKMIDLVARLPPSYKLMQRKLEKHLLRAAFQGWIPDEVLWRSKEGFAEALGKTDIGDIIHRHASSLISDDQFAGRHARFPDRPPESKEEFWYRTIYDACYSHAKIGHVVHVRVYRTAAWMLAEEKENLKELDAAAAKEAGGDEAAAAEAALGRLRRRSTGSSTLSGVVA